MKQALFYFLIASQILFVSCSSEENEPSEILPKTINYIDVTTSKDSLVQISYDGNKIKSLIGEAGRIEFLYEGDFIIKQTRYYTKEGKDVKNDEFSYSYKNDKLFLETHVEGDHKSTRAFTYNDNGTVDVKSNTIYSSGLQEREEKQEYTFVNGNLVKSIYHYNENRRSELKFEYDSNNNPFKNVLGYQLLMNRDICVNNIVKVNNTHVMNGSILSTQNYKTEYIYNDDGYPIKIVSSYSMPHKIIEYIY